MSNKLTSLRRDLDHIRRHRTDIIAQRSRLATRLSELNRALRSKKISYELYESKFKYLLGGKTSEEKKKYFKKRLIAIKHREKNLLSRIKHETHTIAIAAAMLVLFVPLVSVGIPELTGFATSNTSTTASAVVAEWFAVSSPGDINFGTLIHDTTDNNAASNNYGSSATGYYLTLSSDSNIATKTCIKGENFDGPSTLGLGNLTWNSATSSSSSVPGTSGESAMTTSYVTSQSSISPGAKDYYRFWLDVPSGQVAGDYNSTISFKAITTSSSC